MMEKFLKLMTLITLGAMTVFTSCSKDDPEPEPSFENKQVTLYDLQKQPVAYIDYDDEKTIYLWEGIPVAYLVPVEDEEVKDANAVFGFNGKCIGWYCDSIMYDTNGYAVGAEKGIKRGSILTTIVNVETAKGVKHVKPIKHVKEVRPVRHILGDSWSEVLLTDFLNEGIKDNFAN